MSPDEAARRLDAALRPYSWYSSVGIGQTADGPTLFVYVRSDKHRELSKLNHGWQGYRVIVRPVGRIRAIA